MIITKKTKKNMNIKYPLKKIAKIIPSYRLVTRIYQKLKILIKNMFKKKILNKHNKIYNNNNKI